MTKLSVNINKIALIRNSRGSNLPDVIEAAKNCEKYGAHGITVHPRPDERHIRYKDVIALKKILATELNVEGNPTSSFIDLVLSVRPAQVTLVPDSPEALTSNQGWDTIKNRDFLKEVISEFQKSGIRVSIFVDPVEEFIRGAKLCNASRVELYTEYYAKEYKENREIAIAKYIKAAKIAEESELGLNAGHDLNLENLRYFQKNIPNLLEVSIGHALISDAIYFGLENTIQLYLQQLQ